MFPEIESEKGGFAFQKWRVLIGGGDDRKFSVLFHKPGPTAAEALERCIGEFFFEGLVRSEVLFDRLGEFPGRFAAAVRRHHEPKFAVIKVSPDIVTKPYADGLRSLVEIHEEFLGRELGEFGLVREKLVRVSDIGLVVLVVVNPHRFGIDVRLQGLVGIGKRWESVGTGRRRLGLSHQGRAATNSKA